MADAIEKNILDQQLEKNKDKLNEFLNSPELSNDVKQALQSINMVVNGQNDQDISISKIDQGKGEFSNFIDMEFTSKDAVASISLNQDEWKIKSSLNDVEYTGEISDFKELNKTFDSSIIDYDRIERELTGVKEFNLDDVGVKVMVYPERAVMPLDQALAETNLDNINLIVSNNNQEINLQFYSEYDQDTGEHIGYSASAYSHEDDGSFHNKDAFNKIGLDTTIQFFENDNLKIFNEQQVIEIMQDTLDKSNVKHFEINVKDFQLENEVNKLQQNYVSNLERMGALDDFNKSGMNLPNDSLNQIKEFIEEKKYTIGDFEKDNSNSLKFDILDADKTVMTLAIQENGKVELSQGGSTYEITADPSNISSTLEKLNNNFDLEKNREFESSIIPEKKEYQEVLNDASQNWHQNDLKDFKEISTHLIAEHDAKVLGNYNIANMEINLTVHNSVDQPLFEINSTKMGQDIDVVGLQTNENFAYPKNDSMSVELIKQQYSVEEMELNSKVLDIKNQKDAIEIDLEKNFSEEKLIKYESLQAQYDDAVQANSIEFSQEPEQNYNVNLSYSIPSQSQNSNLDIPVETPVSLETNITETPNIRNDQNASIPEQVEQVEPTLSEAKTISSKTDIEQQTPQQPNIDLQEKSAILDKAGYTVPQSVASDFVHTPSDSSFKSSKYYEKANPVAVAFEDRGKTLSSSRDDNKTIAAMVAVAKTKNWNEIQVKGTEEFKRKAWLEAASQGIKVKGFKPTERDMAALEAKQEQISRNQIQHVPQREQQAQTHVKTTQEVKVEHNPNFKEHEQAKIITARRILEESMKKQNKSPTEMEKTLKAFDQMTKNPENVQKLVAAQTKHTKEIEHQKTASQERSR